MKEKIITLIEEEINKFSQYLLEEKHFQNYDFYKAWCAQTYYYTLHTCRLLSKAGEKVENPFVKQAFLSHVDEEMGHENLAAKDYDKLTTGGKVEDFPEFEETKRFWQYIDDEIDKNPMSMFGYALSLEFLAADLGQQAIEHASVHSEGSQSFLHEHFEVDQDHTDKMISMLDHLTAEDLKVVYQATKDNFHAYQQICDACIESANQQKAV